ncbi:uncharacterized protein LOC116613721 [Nematostella vectensis]|uniref:uncharacterized protein LOC116613721 n=1 Tax=Nematostella vectensis TaxID=45351 RepID=UPI002076DBBA|nr:uncharacterized protein LOC116613721 [Nematostella vectensis]
MRCLHSSMSTFANTREIAGKLTPRTVTEGSVYIIVYAALASWLVAGVRPSSTVCDGGLEYGCAGTIGDGMSCVPGCNVTISTRLDPTACSNSCCKICFTECQECVYVRIIILDIRNKMWTSYYADRNSHASTNLSVWIKNGFDNVLSQVNNTRKYKANLLSAIKKNNGITAFLKLSTRTQVSLVHITIELYNASLSGMIGALNVSKFESLSESEFNQRNKPTQPEKSNLDLIETIVACIAASIIMTAVGFCLFFYCTTPFQRRGCKLSCNLTNRVQQ